MLIINIKHRDFPNFFQNVKCRIHLNIKYWQQNTFNIDDNRGGGGNNNNNNSVHYLRAGSAA